MQEPGRKVFTYKLADLGSQTGDGMYLAPEMLNTPKPTDRRPSDIFSFGMSLYRLAYGKKEWLKTPPCMDTSQISAHEIHLPEDFSSDFVDTLRVCNLLTPCLMSVGDDVKKSFRQTIGSRTMHS